VKAGNIILFVIGLLLALLAYPIAWFASVGLAYVFTVIALVLGVLMAVKRTSGAELVLGIVLAVLAVLVLVGIAFTHMAVEKAVETIREATEVKNITASIGERVSACSWAVTVLSIKTSDYVKIGNSYYMPSEGKKIIVVRLRIENIGNEVQSPLDIWDFTLITDTRRGYSDTSFPGIILFNVTSEVEAKALAITQLDRTQKLAPGGSIDADIVFEIPANENPAELHYKVGVIGGYEVTVKLA